MVRDKGLDEACAAVWEASKAGGSWGDTDLFVEIGGDSTVVIDLVNEARSGLGLAELGATSEVVVDVDGELVVGFDGSVERLRERAKAVLDRLNEG